MNTPRILLALAAAAALAGCATSGGPRSYVGHYETGVEQSVRFGVVETIRDVRIDLPPTGVGTAAGAVLGSVAGSHVGGGSGQVVGAIGGAILGGIIGQNVEQQQNQRMGVELTVRLDSGAYVAVVQEVDEPFRPGDRVRILSGRGTTRVTH